MSISTALLERFLLGMGISRDVLTQFRITTRLGESNGASFSRELLQLSAPVVVRGLLNFATLQMNSDWEYPFWVRRQLDPGSDAFIPRAQNPLLVNVTNRNWTMVGTPHGVHEAVIDPRGLITPLPREWSVDLWLLTEEGTIFPAKLVSSGQSVSRFAPALNTVFETDGFEFGSEVFAGTLRSGVDAVFGRCTIRNTSARHRQGAIAIAVRPFNPEGVSPVMSVAFADARTLLVNGVSGIVFEEAADWMAASSWRGGDLARSCALKGAQVLDDTFAASARCDRGLAHAVAAFRFSLQGRKTRTVDFSIALQSESELRATPPAKKKTSLRYDERRAREELRWRKDLQGAVFHFNDADVQHIFDAQQVALHMLCDGDSITPGPWLYHRFWYRDAVPMLRALDLLGQHQRARNVIDAFPRGQTKEGYFRGPDGEWDSNGEVLWALHNHYLLTRSLSWLQAWYPRIKRAATWIVSQMHGTRNGLMPPGLSAEHFGTSDQYYWDSFWSLAGLRAASSMAAALGHANDASRFLAAAETLERSIRDSCGTEGAPVPSAPGRAFDESAIGCVCAVYPLNVFDDAWDAPARTVQALAERFMTSMGYYHPIIHSGCNAYMTMQIAHALLVLGDRDAAWAAAHPVIHASRPPFAFPEATHPRTGGGSMGDGHHGWAAAEIVLFLRDCLVREHEGRLVLLQGCTRQMLEETETWIVENAPTQFGPVSIHLRCTAARFEMELQLSPPAGAGLKSVEVWLPWSVRSVVAMPLNGVSIDTLPSGSRLLCSAELHVLICEL